MERKFIAHTYGKNLHTMNRAENFDDPLYKEIVLGINGEFEQVDHHALFEYERWLAGL